MREEGANYTLEEMDRQSLFHPLTSIAAHMKNGPLIVEHGHGVRIRDHKGRELIDCGAGLWCVNIGYGRPEIAEAAKQAIESLNYCHIFGSTSNEPIIRLADRILHLVPRQGRGRPPRPRFLWLLWLGRQRHQRQAGPLLQQPAGASPAKKKIISRLGGYHGLTCIAGSLTGIPAYHKAWDLPLEGILHTSCPHWYRFARPGESEAAFCDRMIADLEAMIEREGADTIAAFIAEPIMGTGGVLLPPSGYFERVQELLTAPRRAAHRRRGHHRLRTYRPLVRLTTLGRSGARHRHLRQGRDQRLHPLLRHGDLETHLGGARRRPHPSYGPVMHGFTYSGHPVGGAIGLANLDIMENEGLVENAARGRPLPPARAPGHGRDASLRRRRPRRRAHSSRSSSWPTRSGAGHSIAPRTRTASSRRGRSSTA